MPISKNFMTNSKCSESGHSFFLNGFVTQALILYQFFFSKKKRSYDSKINKIFSSVIFNPLSLAFVTDLSIAIFE
ncbi:hypothetical protein C2G38_2055683 [Gigaspora rosea]|uniref:Uncharacterized protein n=1 Tax=Gigaspora rosea TaxID=44941 RepID=A0A397W529_9GLOM|nr:hypothetical protein C2G38_2055683 [Gigaspora rosea]